MAVNHHGVGRYCFLFICVFFAWRGWQLQESRKFLIQTQFVDKKMESVLITLEVPVHPHDSAEVPLIKVSKLCDELVTPGVYPAFTNARWEALAPHSLCAFKGKEKKYITLYTHILDKLHYNT